MILFALDPALQIGSVFEASATGIKITLARELTELTRSHEGRVYALGQIGSLVKLHVGRTILFAMVRLLRLQTEEEAAQLGKPTDSDRRVLEADLIGEAIWNPGTNKLRFDRGVRTYPLPLMQVFIVTTEEAQALYSAIEGERDDGVGRLVPIGTYVGGSGTECRADIDKLFGQHSAILGSTGTGKSTAVAAVLHAVLDHKPQPEKPCHPRIVIIDPHGEYAAAFGTQAIVYRAYNAVAGEAEGTLLRMPYWLMSSDEFRQLVIGKTEFEATSQANIIYKALAHARMAEAGLIERARKDWKDKAATENHPSLPRPCKGVAPEAISGFDRDRPRPFKLEEIVNHIVGEQAIRELKDKWAPVASSTFQEEFGSILDKLHVLRTDPRLAFLMREYAAGDPDLAQILAQFVGAAPAGANAPVRIIDISGLPNEVAGPLTAAIARLLFVYKLHQTRAERECDPILLVCEEAHRYVPDRGEAQYAAAQNAIRRVVREGRKYGLGVMLVSQRPADIESTVISQCNSWLVLRLTNASDQEHVARFLPDSLAGMTKLLAGLPRREAIFVGEAAPLPARIRLFNVREERRPQSADISFAKGWLSDPPPATGLAVVATRMAGPQA